MLKKLIIACLMVVGLAGCGGDNALDLKGTNEFDNFNLTFEYAQTTSRIQPTIPSSYTLYYKPSSTTSEFLDVVFNIENKSKEKKSLNDVIKADFTIDDKDVAGNLILEKEDGSSVSKYGSLEAGQKGKLHVYADIAKGQEVKNVKMTLTVDEKERVMDTAYSDIALKREEKKIGDQIKSKTSEVTFKKVSTSETLKPSHPSSYYRYLKAKTSTNTLVILKTTVKNLQSESLSGSKILGITFVGEDGTTYEAGGVVETKDGSSISQYGSIDANTSTTVYFVGEVAKTVKIKSANIDTLEGHYSVSCE